MSQAPADPIHRALTIRLAWPGTGTGRPTAGQPALPSGLPCATARLPRPPLIRHGPAALLLALLAVVLLLALAALGRSRAESLPGLAAHRGLNVTPGEVWTGRRAPSWMRAALVGTPALAGRSRGEPGREALLSLHEARQRRGCDLSLLTPGVARGRTAAEGWLRLKEQQETGVEPSLWIARTLGQVVRLEGADCGASPSPRRAAGRAAAARPRRGEDGCALLVLGADEPLPTRALPLARLLEMTHLLHGRGILIPPAGGPPESAAPPRPAAAPAATPAPAPAPPGVRPALAEQWLDGLAVYARSAADEAELLAGEARYRRAIAYSGGNLRLAAVAAAVQEEPDGAGPSLLTLALAPADDVDGLREALDARRTVALRGPGLPDLELPGLGQVLQTAEVRLRLELGHPVDRIELWREEERVAVATGEAVLEHQDQIRANCAYTFKIVHGQSSALTSGIWFEPVHSPQPDLAIDPISPAWDEGLATAVVRNEGDAAARFVRVGFFDRLPGSGAVAPIGVVEIDLLHPGEALPVDSFMPRQPPLLYVAAGSALGIGWEPSGESELRNNAVYRPLRGAPLLRWEAAQQLRLRRAELRSGPRGRE